jgi:hypothetical protein
MAAALLGALLLVTRGCSEDAPLDALAERAPGVQSAALERQAEPLQRPHPPAVFEECSSERGLHFQWRSGHQGRYLNPEIVGGGVALLDYDGDGDLDVLFIQGGGVLEPRRDGHRLFANDGRGFFTDVTAEAGITSSAFGMGVAVGDFDNDGDEDVYITSLGPNVLWRNDGGRFTDVTEAAGVGDASWSSSAAFLDVDGDGDLDLYVCNYIHWSPGRERVCVGAFDIPDYCTPTAYQAPARDTLYLNRGDGTFEDATTRLGIDGALGTGLGIAFGRWFEPAPQGDPQSDARNGRSVPQIFVANDGMMNHLWVATEDGRFEEQALRRGCATGESGQVKAGMGVAIGDVDEDGDLDLLIVNLRGETDSLFLNEGRWFRDATAAWKLATPSRRHTRFGVGLVDFDHDGRLDLYHANGGVQALSPPLTDDPYAEPNALFRNRAVTGGQPLTAGDGSLRAGGEAGLFEEWLPRGGTHPELVHTSRGAAFGDLDGDGAVDIVVVNRDGPAYLLRNVLPDRGNWIMLRVLERSGRHALGAEVRITVGDREVRRDVNAAASYCASNDPRVHVGLGRATRIDAMEVRWPDGAVEVFPGADAGQVIEVRRGTGRGV